MYSEILLRLKRVYITYTFILLYIILYIICKKCIYVYIYIYIYILLYILLLIHSFIYVCNMQYVICKKVNMYTFTYTFFIYSFTYIFSYIAYSFFQHHEYRNHIILLHVLEYRKHIKLWTKFIVIWRWLFLFGSKL